MLDDKKPDAVESQPQNTAQGRVQRLIALGEAARASRSELDLANAQLELGSELGAPEVTIMLGFVNGDIDEARARQLLTAAQTQKDIQQLLETSKALQVIDEQQFNALSKHAERAPELIENAKQAQQPPAKDDAPEAKEPAVAEASKEPTVEQVTAKRADIKVVGGHTDQVAEERERQAAAKNVRSAS